MRLAHRGEPRADGVVDGSDGRNFVDDVAGQSEDAVLVLAIDLGRTGGGVHAGDIAEIDGRAAGDAGHGQPISIPGALVLRAAGPHRAAAARHLRLRGGDPRHHLRGVRHVHPRGDRSRFGDRRDPAPPTRQSIQMPSGIGFSSTISIRMLMPMEFTILVSFKSRMRVRTPSSISSYAVLAISSPPTLLM